MKKRSFISGFLFALTLVSLISSAAATIGRQTAELDYNDIDVTLNGQAVVLADANGNPVEPFAINGTTYLPVRAIANALGLTVGWNQDTTTVTLTAPKSTYITRTGKKYHFDSTCNGGTYWEVPYDSAIGMGLTPCDKCVHE